MKKRIARLDAKLKRGAENLLLADSESFADASKILAQWRKEREMVANELEVIVEDSPITPDELVARTMARLDNLQEELQNVDPAYVRDALKS